MRKLNFIVRILIGILLALSCSSDNEQINHRNSGLLKTAKNYIGEIIDTELELKYNNDSQISSLTLIQGNFLELTYTVEYEGKKVRTITFNSNLKSQPSNPTITEIYQVDYIANEIILTLANSETKKVFTVTDGFVDSYKSFYGPNNIYQNESVFKRDADNNIESITYYTTYTPAPEELIWKYTFSNFDNDAILNSAYNPVFNYSHSLYDYVTGLILNLEISKGIPLNSSMLDGNENYKEDHVTANIEVDEHGKVFSLSYEYSDLPSNDYLLEFQYY